MANSRKDMTCKEFLKQKHNLKVCSGCEIINWHENKKCWLCGIWNFRCVLEEDLVKIRELSKDTPLFC